MNILFTCAGRRTYLLEYFKEQLAGEGMIIGTDMCLSAPALSIADVQLVVPSVYADNYIDIILNICKKYQVDILISLNDLELPIIAKHKNEFEHLGTTAVVSSSDIINLCFDKYKTVEWLDSIGLKFPKTYISLDEVRINILEGKLSFPLILKPRWGSGSIGIEQVNDMEELEIYYQLLFKKIKNTILSTASIGDQYILIQEKLIGKEYGLDVMNDLEGNHISVSVKEKLAMRAGETDKAMTVNNSELNKIGFILGKNLKHIGNLDVDVFLCSNGDCCVLELNPRFGGGFPFSYKAGVNLPKAIIEWKKGNIVDKTILQPRYGEVYAKCDYLIQR